MEHEEDIQEAEVIRDLATQAKREEDADKALSPLAIPLNQLALDQASAALGLLPKFRRMLIQATSPQDWMQLGKNMYPMDAASMKIGGLAGVSFTDGSVEQSSYRDERGPVVMFVARVTASFRNRVIQEEGCATSAEQFFNGTEEVTDAEGKTKKQVRRLPLSEINVPNVRKKALTNAKGRAARKLLGLYFTPEEVTAAFQAAGGDVSKLGAVGYGGKSAEKAAGAGKGVMSAEKQQLFTALMEIAEGDKETAQEILFHNTKFPKKDKDGNPILDEQGNPVEHGSRSVLEMSDAWVKKTLPKILSLLAKFRAEKAAEGQPQ